MVFPTEKVNNPLFNYLKQSFNRFKLMKIVLTDFELCIHSHKNRMLCYMLA